VPESRHKYLYERLGDHDFQLLTNALLSAHFPDFRPLPLRQRDGGRDGIQITDEKVLIYQTKWSVTGSEKDPIKWLNATVTKEHDNLRRLASKGVRHYYLVTNVPSTAQPNSGTFDRLNVLLDEHARNYGFDKMECLWREAVDTFVDNASNEIKWAYADMLAGWDLIRYLLSEQVQANQDSNIRKVLRKIAQTQWAEDELVKFSQVDVDREKVEDLFIDVNAILRSVPVSQTTTRISPRQPGQGSIDPAKTAEPVGAVAQYLLRTEYPFTLIRGAPGQGKSTLSQFVAQTYRRNFIKVAPIAHAQVDGSSSNGVLPRFPIRCDLADYAAWLAGVDIFDDISSDKPSRRKAKKGAESGIENFLAELATRLCGGTPVSVETVADIFDRVPILLILDGLDEVGSASVRKRVVAEIDALCVRANAYAVSPKLVVTTRPNAGGLEEPSRNLFQVLVLEQLTHPQRDEYLRKWCLVHDIHGSAGRAMRRTFREKSAEPYINELAGNPMQLTILLDLLHQQGDATPSQRTDLYDACMSLLLAREANKHPTSVKKHRADLFEIIPFLGWYIQSRSEESPGRSRMTTDAIKEAMKHFQRTYGKSEKVVDDLFTAATDRMWALTSKEVGFFEFEVLSLREYFAARFLYDYAGDSETDVDRLLVFRELMRRPYWLNTLRFYSGNAKGSGILVPIAGIEDELRERPTSHAIVAAWTLLVDGVFASRPRGVEAVINAICSDDNIGTLYDLIINEALSSSSAVEPIGPSHSTFQRFTSAIKERPNHDDSFTRARILLDLLGSGRLFQNWWAAQLVEALDHGNAHEWLELGAQGEIGAGIELDAPNLDIEDAELYLNSGLRPPDKGPLENILTKAVLGGQYAGVASIRSTPGCIAVAFSVGRIYSIAPDDGYFDCLSLEQYRALDLHSQALRKLRRDSPTLARIASDFRFRKGQKGTTYPWSNTATKLLAIYPRTWLPIEIAVVAAASNLENGFSRLPDTPPFGPNGQPATLIEQTRANRSTPEWWREHIEGTSDDFTLAECFLALWAVATGPTIDKLWSLFEHGISELPRSLLESVFACADRLGAFGFLDGRPVSSTATTDLGSAFLQSRSRPSTMGGGVQVVGLPSRNKAPVQPLAALARDSDWFAVDRNAYH
jgi:hypothetical protein